MQKKTNNLILNIALTGLAFMAGGIVRTFLVELTYGTGSYFIILPFLAGFYGGSSPGNNCFVISVPERVPFSQPVALGNDSSPWAALCRQFCLTTLFTGC